MTNSLSNILAGAVGETLPDQAIDRILEAVRTHLGMDIAFASRFVDGRREFTHINADKSVPAKPGDSEPQEDTYCYRILQGRLPELIIDAKDHPEATALPITAALPVGSHLNVPLRLSDGSVYGSFCCLSHQPDRTLTSRDLDTVRAFAALAAEQIESELGDEAERRERVGRITEVIEQDRIAMVYQPIHRLADGRPVGVEALARFPDQATRTPDRWFAEAARIGLGTELEMLAVRQALRGLPFIPAELYVAVNVSPATALAPELERVIADAPDGRLVVEVTEHSKVADYDALCAALTRLSGRARLAHSRFAARHPETRYEPHPRCRFGPGPRRAGAGFGHLRRGHQLPYRRRRDRDRSGNEGPARARHRLRAGLAFQPANALGRGSAVPARGGRGRRGAAGRVAIADPPPRLTSLGAAAARAYMRAMSIRPWRDIVRRKSRQIMVGNVPVGGGAPVTVQTMTNTPTSDAKATIDQIRRCEEVGVDIIRVSCPDIESTAALGQIVRASHVPIVADIHFHYKRALEAADAGAACLRINPGNIGSAERVAEVVRAAKANGCSMRIGVNAGSLERDLLEKYGEPCPEALVESALDHIKLLQDHDFHEYKVAVKASDHFLAVAAYQQLAEAVDCPLHLGITEAGGQRGGTVKSAIGIGNLLWLGIGDTIRVSLSAEPEEEVRVGYEILKSLGIRRCRCRCSAASSTAPARRARPISASPAAARASTWSISPESPTTMSRTPT